MSDEKKLVFIYNADSGVINLVKDFWKKILRPSSYQCNLCMQTFGAFGMKKDWKKFINNLKIDVEFLHKDEFEKDYEITGANYPSAYIETENGLELFISQDEMNAVKTIDELKEIVDKKFEKLP